MGDGMTGPEEARADQKMTLEVGYMPLGHTVVGYIAYVKMLDENGEFYWGSRSDGLNAMESLGMAHDMVQEYTADLASSRRDPGDHDD